MVSAVSSQAATLNPLAYMAQADDDTTKQATPDATANYSDRGPATQVSLSQEAIDSLKAAVEQGPDAARQALDAWSQASSERFAASIKLMQATSDANSKKFAIDQANYEIERYDWQQETNEHFAESIKMLQEKAVKWANTTPVPAVQLTEAQIADILKKVASRGIDPSKIGGADNYSFGYEGKIYTFKKDGTAWVNDSGVPISEDQKQLGIKGFAQTIQQASSKIHYPSVSREDLVAQRDALMAQ